MKFESKSDFLTHQYSIDLEKIISPVYHLIIELYGQGLESPLFPQWGINLFDVKAVYGIDKIPEYETTDTFLTKVSRFLENDLYLTVNSLKGTGIELLFRDRSLLVVNNAKCTSINNVLTTWVKNYNPIDRLFCLLLNEDVKKLSTKFQGLINNVYYNVAISVGRGVCLSSCMVKTSWCNIDGLRYSIIDPSSIWIDGRIYDIVGDIETSVINEICDDETLFAIQLGEYIVPLQEIDNRILPEYIPSYFWKMLGTIYAPGTNPKVDKTDTDRFLEAGKDSEFCKLLSNLKFNLYLQGDYNLSDQYMDMFEEVYSLDKLPYMDNFTLFTGLPLAEQVTAEHTLVGVYEKEKTNKEYNLLNWVNASANGYTVTKSNQSVSKEGRKVFALKPHLSYYLCSKYYEDSFMSMLKELGCNFKSNFYLYLKGIANAFAEIDSIIFKPNNTLVYVENKTCMNNFNIEDTIRRIEKFNGIIESEYPYVKVQYIMAAPFCDDSIEQHYRYFLKEGGKIEERQGFGHKILDFSIPLAQFENISLRCIVEPEYEQMKSKIYQLLQ